MSAFDSIPAFLAMGGHGVYVWSAWGVTALFLGLCLLQAHLERRALMKVIARRARRERTRTSTAPQSAYQEGRDDA